MRIASNYKKRGTFQRGTYLLFRFSSPEGMEGILEKGWRSRKSIPAAYLTGYVAGRKALLLGAKNAILYTGTKRYTQRMAAALKGVIDAGLEVPADAETFPPAERINGEHLSVKNEVLQIKSTIDGGVG